MEKEVWVDCRNQNLEDLAIQYHATGIFGKSKRGLRTLPEDFEVHAIGPKIDVEQLVRQHHGKKPYFGVKLPDDYKYIISENLIAMLQDSGTKLIVETNNLNDIRVYACSLEVGVDGVLVSNPTVIENAVSIFLKRI